MKKKKLFKSIETCDTTVCSDFSSLIVENIKEKVLLQNTKTEQETTQIFLKKIWVYLTKQSSNSKKLQGDSQKMSCGIKFALADWLLQIATIYTKMNFCCKINWPIKPKTTPLAAQITFGGPNLKTQATTSEFKMSKLHWRSFILRNCQNTMT